MVPAVLLHCGNIGRPSVAHCVNKFTLAFIRTVMSETVVFFIFELTFSLKPTLIDQHVCSSAENVVESTLLWALSVIVKIPLTTVTAKFAQINDISRRKKNEKFIQKKNVKKNNGNMCIF